MVPKEILYKRAALVQAARLFFIESGYLEVDTPVRLPSIIPESYIVPFRSEGKFLQTSPELCMKRLLACGVPKLLQICKCFREGERGRLHLPEFTMLEWYRVGADYFDLMDECEEFFSYIATSCSKGKEILYDGKRISLKLPWERLTVGDAFERYAPVSVDESIEKGMFEEMLVKHVEPYLGIDRPTFMYDYPVAHGALARTKEWDKTVAERFELYVGGLELANGFSELTDANEQRQRFEKERENIVMQGRDPGPMPEKFLDALEKIPGAAGIALGLDRLIMLFVGATSIDDVVAFVPEQL
jgi:lysyl-tRNA synthetase class 2